MFPENNLVPKSRYIEYCFQKIGQNFSYPVSEKFTTSETDSDVSCEVNEENVADIVTIFSLV
jgi:hypothetical protein